VKLDLVSIQLEIGAGVLASHDAYRRHLDEAADRALASARADARFVVFPELAGHLALYALGGPAAHRAKTLSGALAAAALRRPLEVLRGAATARRLDGRHAILAALAPDGERWWRSVFGPLARRHRAYVVAGSHLRLGLNGELTNASLLFDPEGSLVATTDKVNLVPGVEDAAKGGLALARGDASAVPITATPFGKVATLIGYDASREPYTRDERFGAMAAKLAERGGVAVVANPVAPTSAFAGREGLAATLAETPFARWGVTAHLVGHVLDLAFAGTSQILGCTGTAVSELARADDPDRGGHVTATISC
jgi:predicted amidohydrolase